MHATFSRPSSVLGARRLLPCLDRCEYCFSFHGSEDASFISCFHSFVNKPNLLGHLRQCSVVLPCLTLCDPMGCSPPGSSVHGISQARIMEWVGISFSRRSSRLRDQTCISCISCVGRQISLPLSHLGSPICDSSYLPNQAKPSLGLGLLDSESQVYQISSRWSGSVILTQVFLELKHTGYLTFWVA